MGQSLYGAISSIRHKAKKTDSERGRVDTEPSRPTCECNGEISRREKIHKQDHNHSFRHGGKLKLSKLERKSRRTNYSVLYVVVFLCVFLLNTVKASDSPPCPMEICMSVRRRLPESLGQYEEVELSDEDQQIAEANALKAFRNFNNGGGGLAKVDKDNNGYIDPTELNAMIDKVLLGLYPPGQYVGHHNTEISFKTFETFLSETPLMTQHESENGYSAATDAFNLFNQPALHYNNVPGDDRRFITAEEWRRFGVTRDLNEHSQVDKIKNGWANDSYWVKNTLEDAMKQIKETEEQAREEAINQQSIMLGLAIGLPLGTFLCFGIWLAYFRKWCCWNPSTQEDSTKAQVSGADQDHDPDGSGTVEID